MKNIVHYLCFYQDVGFLFPDELPDNYYFPGLFLVETKGDGKLSYDYSFDAMESGRRISLTMVRANEGEINSTLYSVRTEHFGSFGFNLERINPKIRYGGQRSDLLNHRHFFAAVSIDQEKLERVCREFDFYFIGSTERNSELNLNS